MARRKTGRWSAGIAGAALGVAAGSALGAYVLAPAGGVQWGGGEAAAERDAAIVQRDDAVVRADAANDVVGDLTADVVGGTLRDVPVLLLTTPDADPEAVRAMEATLRDAGAPETATIGLTEKFRSAQGADELKDVVTGALPTGTTLDVDRRDPGFQAGQALSPVLLLGGEGERAPVADRRLLLGSLRDAGFIDYRDGTVRPSAAVVILTGSGKGDGEDPGVGSRILADFAEALAADGTVVVAGDPSSARDDGVIEVLETSATGGAVHTQPAIGDAAGRVGVVRDIVSAKKRPAQPPASSSAPSEPPASSSAPSEPPAAEPTE